MDLIVTLLWVVFGVASAIYLFFKKKYSYWKDRQVKYIEPKFPLGNLAVGQHFKDISDQMYKQKDASGIVGGYIVWKPILVPTSLDLIQSILIKDFNVFQNRGFFYNEDDDPLSAHLFSLDGDKWKSIRTKLSPTFTSGKMKFMFSTIIEVSQRLVAKLSEEIRIESEPEISDILGRYTTEVIGSCAFGIECNALKTPNEPFVYYSKKFFEEPHLNVVMLMLTTFYPELSRKLHVRFLDKDVSDFFTKCVSDTIEYREKNNVRRNDFMELIIQMKNSDNQTKWSQTDLAAQCFLFFIAGYETSKTTMMYALYELAKNPDIQDRLRQEIEAILAKHDNELTYEATQDMPYLDKVINETLRMYPPVNFLKRQAMRDYQIPNSKTIIDKGIGIFIPVYQIHHDPEIYENPEVFDPERFSPEKVKERHPMSFLGFGEGPRNCIGFRFGRMQSRIGMAALLRQFRFSVSPKTPIVLEIDPNNPIMTPKNGIILKVKKI